MTDLMAEVREALTWYDRKCFTGTIPPQPGSLLARIDGMTIVPAGEVERLREALRQIAEFSDEPEARMARAALGEEDGR